MTSVAWNATLILIYLLFNCSTTTSHKDFRSSIGKVYGESTPDDKKEIIELNRLMVDAIIEEDMERLLPYIHPKLGIWVDLKSEWTKEQFVKDLKNPEGYINVYFLSTEKLRKKKNSMTANSVKDILLKSNGFYLDLYFDEGECELDIKFRSAKNYENDLIHPVFKKMNNKWYIYRLL
ncbi:MAG: hypothetical protein JJT78_03435 [Leptospira sp.]|nr:hypothetical protein [Leptospira sp.]